MAFWNKKRKDGDQSSSNDNNEAESSRQDQPGQSSSPVSPYEQINPSEPPPIPESFSAEKHTPPAGDQKPSAKEPKFPKITIPKLRKQSAKDVKDIESTEDSETNDETANEKEALPEVPKTPSPKSRLIAFLLCFFLGGLGAHRLYAGRTKSGIAMILTLGGLGVWSLVDLVMIASGKFTDHLGRVLVNWDLPSAGSSEKYALIIRTNQVECVSMKDTKITHLGSSTYVDGIESGLSSAIKQAVEGVALAKKKIAVAIPTEDVLFRFFSIPEMPKGEWEAAIKFEARKYIPFKTEDLVWAHHVHPVEGQSRLDVVFVGIQKTIYESIAMALTDAGINPAWVEPRTLSLARLVSLSQKSSEVFRCIVDISEDSAHIAIIKNGDPYLARDVSLAPRSDIVSVEESPQDGEKEIKTEKRVQREDPRLDRLINELSVSIDFLVREYPSAQVERVLLFGDDALIEKWKEEVEAQCSCPVDLGDTVYPQSEEKIALADAVILGLLTTARDARKNAIDFHRRATVREAPNLANINIKTSAIKTDQLVAAVKTPQTAVFGVLSIAFLIAVWALSSRWVPNAEKELQVIRQQSDQAANALSGISKEQIDAVRGSVQKQVAFLRQVLRNRVRFSEKMNVIAQKLPEGVWLSELSYDNKLESNGKSTVGLSIDGACYLGEPAKELVAIQAFESNVKKDRLFAAGFQSMRIQKINAEVSRDGNFNYRTFELECDS